MPKKDDRIAEKQQQLKDAQSKSEPVTNQPDQNQVKDKKTSSDLPPSFMNQLPKNVKVKKVEINLNKMKNQSLLYLLIGLLFVPFLIKLFLPDKNAITLSELVKDVRDQKVKLLEVAGDELDITYNDGTEKTARKEMGQQALEVMKAAGIDFNNVNLKVKNVSNGEMILTFLFNLLPLFMTVAMLVFFAIAFRQAKGGQDGILGIGRSKAKVFIKGKQDIKFADVGGMDEAKQELSEIVDFLKQPKKYTKVGARTPKGVLLVGPSGTGKTLLARAVAGEANVQFLSIAGSEFMEMLVGVGASRVRDLFSTAKKLSPAIIFIDEIDAIGRMRGLGGGMGGHDEREQTLNQILVEMDGFTKNDNVIVMAATNRGDMLDPALVRPGRFDRRVLVSLPDLKERTNILKIHSQGKPMDPAVDLDKTARSTVGFSGADLENMLNEAAIAVARNNRTMITKADLDEAGLKVKLGPSKKRLHDEYERKMTAYHEAGHAVLAHVLPHTDPVNRISIVSRGQALGYTFTPPEKDKLQITKSELLEDIMVMLGGRSAEQIIFNEQTAGASNDIEQATRLARAMVVEYGMSELGPMNFGPMYETSYSKSWGEPAKISDQLQEKVDQEIGQIIKAAQERANKLLNEHKQKLIDVSDKLLEVETLDAEEFIKVMGSPKTKNL